MRIGLSLLSVLAASAAVALDPPSQVDAKAVQAKLKGEWREFDADAPWSATATRE